MRSIDLSLAILGLLAGFVLLLVAIVISKGIGIAATIACSCAVYLMLRRFKSDSTQFAPTLAIRESTFGTFLIVTTGLVTVFFLVSVGSLYYMRPLEYFLLACLLCGMIGVEISLSHRDSSKSTSWIILSQILLVSASLSWGRLFEFSGLAGGDWYHSVLTSYIIDNGHILPATYSLNWMPVDVTWYRNFPFMHLVVSMFAIVTGVTSYKDSATFSIGMFEIASLVFVFLAGRRFFPDSRLSLLSTLILGMSSPHVLWGIWLIPQAFGVGLFAMMIYLLLNPSRNNARYLIPLVLLSLVLAHTISSLIAVIVILLFSTSDVFFSRFTSRVIQSTTVQLAILSSTLLLAQWTFFSTFLGQHVYYLELFFSSVRILGLSPVGKSYFSYELDNIGNYVFYFMGIIGFLTWIVPENRTSIRFKTTMSAILLLGFVYLLYFLSIPELLPDRWFPFIFILLSFPAAVGLWRLTQVRNKRMGAILMLLLLCSSTFFMITNSNVADDAPLIGTSQVRSSSLLDSETVPAIWLRNHSHARIFTDLGYSDYFWGALRTNMTPIDFQNFLRTDGILLVRNSIFERPTPMQISGGPYVVVSSQFRNSLVKVDKVYSDGEVNVYLP